MNKLVFLLAIGVGVFYFKQKADAEDRRRSAEYQRVTASAGGDNCTGKSTCVVVYVTPWCPACKQIKPHLVQALERSKTVQDSGFKVVVGQGKTPQSNEEEAMSYGAGAVTDNDGSQHRALAVESYPSFFVLDGNQKITMQGQDAANQFSRTFLAPR